MRGCPRGDGWGGMHGFILGACVVLFGGHSWFYSGGCAWFYSGGHAWFYSAGGMRGFIWGACVVLFSGGGMHGFIQRGDMRGFIQGGMRGFFSFSGYNEIRSMRGRYASYWNAFLLLNIAYGFQAFSCI